MRNLHSVRIILFFSFLSLFPFKSFADEGMWIPSLLEKYNISIMQDKGLKLTAEDIYSINNASLKDATIIFGNGCTGAVISSEGLVITNHHCAYESIQKLSSVEKDYLTSGYWAMNKNEELPVNGLKVTFLIRIEDVSSLVLEGLDGSLNEIQRREKVDAKIRKISRDAVQDTHYKAVIKPFYYGNEYYMFVYEDYNDIRLVGAPPSALGNFGADPDNWIWPRHTGDFTVFRIYAGDDNAPAPYSPDNKPYSPKKVIPINTSGYSEGDFTMILGYPGTTSQFLISPAVEMIYKSSMVKKIALRDKRLEIMNKYMGQSDVVRIQYASKYRSVSNAWKKWQGVVWGMARVDGLAVKSQQEDDFTEWVNQDVQRKEKYGNLLPDMYRLYNDLKEYNLVYEYAHECVLATEIFSLFYKIGGIVTENKEKSDRRKTYAKERFFNDLSSFFKDYHEPLDVEMFASMLEYFYTDVSPKFHPPFYKEIHGKYKGDYKQFADETFHKSRLISQNSIENLFSDYPERESKIRSVILKDPLYKIFSSFFRMYSEQVYAPYEYIIDELEIYYRTYVKALREMNTQRIFYPDANFTMRLTYGKIEGYAPQDAVFYHYKTQIGGKIEKFKTGIPDYKLPERLIGLIASKDFGKWADKDGNLYTCFIASNHTSGGNSGSPVLNGEGHLIGINFDRNWEGTMNDFIYDPEQCRNISLDIRYVLFIIDKYAGAGHLIEEMILLN